MKWLSLILSSAAVGINLFFLIKRKREAKRHYDSWLADMREEIDNHSNIYFLEGYENAESLRLENLYAVYQKLSPLKRKIFHQVIQNLENGKAISPDILDDIHEFDDLMEAIAIIACCYDKRQKYKNKHVE